MKVLVCGGRKFDDRKMLGRTMAELTSESPIALVITGGAPGADAAANRWAENNRIPLCVFPANWQFAGRRAGPMRNQAMLEFGKPDLVIAFPGGVGTEDMIRRAEQHGVEVRRIGIWYSNGEAA